MNEYLKSGNVAKLVVQNKSRVLVFAKDAMVRVFVCVWCLGLFLCYCCA